MTLRLTLALAAICWLFLLANAWAGCGGPEPTHLPTCHPVKLYALRTVEIQRELMTAAAR